MSQAILANLFIFGPVFTIAFAAVVEEATRERRNTVRAIMRKQRGQ